MSKVHLGSFLLHGEVQIRKFRSIIGLNGFKYAEEQRAIDLCEFDHRCIDTLARFG
ncbi:hypothetical protein HNQ34_002024 [Anoxybacillus tepidamans]|uniref:Uncharacterized protein n=1 Tax=Anoxybacteroides tepidamans TaxID=265948 RepID=A0A7W8IQN0_9BACL|nr:hypothetical protein [Anoxybacillus tepidamans]